MNGIRLVDLKKKITSGQNKADASTESELATLIAELSRSRNPFDDIPLIELMKSNLRRPVLLLKLSSLALLGMFLLLAAVYVNVEALWIELSTTFFVGLIALTLAAVILGSGVVPRALGLYLTRFLVATEHDCAVAALRVALKEGRPLILYLREFEHEQTSLEYWKIEHQLIDLCHDALILVSLCNPGVDPTVRISRVPKMVCSNRRWERLIELLILRADRVILAAGTIGKGVRFEIDTLSRTHAADKSLLVKIGNAFPAELDLADSFKWQPPTLNTSLAQSAEVWDWLQDLAIFAPTRPTLGARIHVRRYSRSLRFLPASIYLLGVWSLLPRSDIFLYRQWLRSQSNFDPMHDIRDELLDAENRAIKSGIIVPPLRLVFKQDDSSPEFVKGWNRKQLLTMQLENAAMVFYKLETWRRIRKGLGREHLLDRWRPL